jgi:hypothetical protein
MVELLLEAAPGDEDLAQPLTNHLPSLLARVGEFHGLAQGDGKRVVGGLRWQRRDRGGTTFFRRQDLVCDARQAGLPERRADRCAADAALARPPEQRVRIGEEAGLEATVSEIVAEVQSVP